MQRVEDLIKQIHDERFSKDKKTYETRSLKDEIAVTKAMLNDKEYTVSVYGNTGLKGVYAPSNEIRKGMANILSSTTGMSKIESRQLMYSYEFSNSDAKVFLNFAKEFVNTYTQTGRKLYLGGREKSNISLVRKTIPAKTVKSPVQIGEDRNGNPIFENIKETKLESYESMKVLAPYPKWLKKD